MENLNFDFECQCLKPQAPGSELAEEGEQMVHGSLWGMVGEKKRI